MPSLLKDLAKISLHIVLEQQADTNTYFSKHHQQSSNRFYAFVFNSKMVKLYDNICNKLSSFQQGGITLTMFTVDDILFISHHVISSRFLRAKV